MREARMEINFPGFSCPTHWLDSQGVSEIPESFVETAQFATALGIINLR
jgi:hypothetical protein